MNRYSSVPCGKRSGSSWRVLRAQAKNVIAVDFLAVDTIAYVPSARRPEELTGNALQPSRWASRLAI
jgi:hypothetical protein